MVSLVTFKLFSMGQRFFNNYLNNEVSKVDEFIRRYVVRDENEKVPQDLMYVSYLIYCDKEGLKPRNLSWFGREMKMFGFGATRNGKGELEHLRARLRY